MLSISDIFDSISAFPPRPFPDTDNAHDQQCKNKYTNDDDDKNKYPIVGVFGIQNSLQFDLVDPGVDFTTISTQVFRRGRMNQERGIGHHTKLARGIVDIDDGSIRGV